MKYGRRYNGENTLAYNVKDEEMYLPDDAPYRCDRCGDVEVKEEGGLCPACKSARAEYLCEQ